MPLRRTGTISDNAVGAVPVLRCSVARCAAPGTPRHGGEFKNGAF